MGIAYSVVGDHEGTRVKIESAYKVKEHFEVPNQVNRWQTEITFLSFRKQSSLIHMMLR